MSTREARCWDFSKNTQFVDLTSREQKDLKLTSKIEVH